LTIFLKAFWFLYATCACEVFFEGKNTQEKENPFDIRDVYTNSYNSTGYSGAASYLPLDNDKVEIP
jgi:hypothetical protein